MKCQNHFSLLKGLSIHIAATVSFLIDSMTGSCEIFCNADIRAYLSFVSSTDHASARNSLFLDMANCIRGNAKYHNIKKHNHTINMISVICQFFLFDDQEDDLIAILNNISHIVAIAHINTIITIISIESLFII
jgi:hypothetical protein